MKNRRDPLEDYHHIRWSTEKLCAPLMTEDYVIQTHPDVSPPKWHLAHTTWFFETFLLLPHYPKYKIFNTSFQYLFNSYYHGVGEFFPRSKRGFLSRPSVQLIYDYRAYVDQFIKDNISQFDFVFQLGLNHEQQHQELLLMDIKYNFFMDPHFPVYQSFQPSSKKWIPLTFLEHAGGLVDIGHQGPDFCFDNELPRHRQYLQPFKIANRLVNNAEFSEFIDAGGYRDPQWWLSDGWEQVRKNRWESPLYWKKCDNNWFIFTLNGLQELNPNEPVSHVSYYEADAYAKWRGCRLPTEAEWESSTDILKTENKIFMEDNILHPQQDDLWEWTASAYLPYPGFKPFSDKMMEYNGKFMNNQMVLRGGSCITPRTHFRNTYRNFFQPEKRWQFSGIRLAKELE